MTPHDANTSRRQHAGPVGLGKKMIWDFYPGPSPQGMSSWRERTSTLIDIRRWASMKSWIGWIFSNSFHFIPDSTFVITLLINSALKLQFQLLKNRGF